MIFFALYRLAAGIINILMISNKEYWCFGEIQFIHLTLAARFGIFTVFIVGLAKWFSRA
jgi:hypothetical protein